MEKKRPIWDLSLHQWQVKLNRQPSNLLHNSSNHRTQTKATSRKIGKKLRNGVELEEDQVSKNKRSQILFSQDLMSLRRLMMVLLLQMLSRHHQRKMVQLSRRH